MITLALAVAIVTPPAWAFIYSRVLGALGYHPPWLVSVVWAGSGVIGAVLFAGAGLWLPGAVSAGHILVAAAIWWHRRRRRRGAAPLGAKSRARIKAMVRTMKQRARLRRVLRPAHGGAW